MTQLPRHRRGITMERLMVTMREIAAAIHKPESTVYRWKKENHDLFQAAKEFAERKKQKDTLAGVGNM